MTILQSDVLLTAQQVADRLGISRRTVWNLLLRGLLPRIHVTPRIVRIPASAVVEYLKARASVRRAK